MGKESKETKETNSKSSCHKETTLHDLHKDLHELKSSVNLRDTEVTEAINANTAALEELSELLKVYQDAKGFVHVIQWVGTTLKWLAVVGVACASLWYFITNGSFKDF